MRRGIFMWLLFGLLAAVSAALIPIFGKLGLQGVDTSAATALRAIIMAIFLTGVAVVQGKFALVSEIIADNKDLLLITLSGVAGALSWLFYFFALKYGDVTKVAPLDRLSVVFAIILAAVVLGEKVSIWGGIGAAMLGLGAIIMVTLG